MEQFFVIIAFVVFWVFRNVARTQRRVPGQDPYDGESVGPGAHIDISGTARQKTLESQRRALEALQRWEEKQKLAGGYGGPPQPGPESIPAASRTRVGRPATSRSRAAAQRRKEAFTDIARMLDPAQQTSRPRLAKPEPAAERKQSDAALKREAVAAREDAAVARAEAAREEAAAQATETPAGREKGEALSALARLEKLPLAARAIVYSEILGRPRSLS